MTGFSLMNDGYDVTLTVFPQHALVRENIRNASNPSLTRHGDPSVSASEARLS